MRHLGPLKQLQYLSLSSTRVTGIGLGYLPVDNLSILHLTDTDITDQELATLRRFAELTQLLLARTRISDDGLSHLRQLPRLRKLDLDDTQITDEGLKEISTFAVLDSVSLRGCPNITVEAVREIERASPRLYMSLDKELLMKLRGARGVQ